VVQDIVSWLLIAGGAFFVMVGGIGLVRMPDFFTRLHPASVTDTMGAGLLLTGFMVQAGASLITVKLVLILVFLLFTSPTAAHALAHAALLDGLKPWTGKKDGAP
jgi:multicomponent Na+:H+ antiporter subunit G